MRRRLVLAAGAVALLTAVASALPAAAAPSGATTVTFAITAGGLDITVPGSASLGSGVPGGSISGQLGSVSVTDTRALLTGAWMAKVTSTAFTTGGGTADETIPVGSVRYWSGPATATSGLGVFVPGQLTALLAATLTTTNGPTAFSKALAVGNSSATWNPTLIVDVPAAAVAGTYTGTVTHSVA